MAFIAGGAAIVANNTAHPFLKRGKRMIVCNNMSKSNVELNDRWLRNPHGDEVTAVKEDVKDIDELRRAAKERTRRDS